jgi:hypothetical protein
MSVQMGYIPICAVWNPHLSWQHKTSLYGIQEYWSSFIRPTPSIQLELHTMCAVWDYQVYYVCPNGLHTHMCGLEPTSLLAAQDQSLWHSRVLEQLYQAHPVYPTRVTYHVCSLGPTSLMDSTSTSLYNIKKRWNQPSYNNTSN